MINNCNLKNLTKEQAHLFAIKAGILDPNSDLTSLARMILSKDKQKKLLNKLKELDFIPTKNIAA